MKKYVYSIIVLTCFVQYVHTQSIDKKEFILDTVYRYEIINPCVYELLDTLSSSLHDCIFNALNRDYFFDIDIYENDNIRGQIFAYSSYTPFSFAPIASYRGTKTDNKGFFYYKNNLVLVEFKGNHVNQNRIKMLFSKADTMKTVKYQAPKESLPEVGMGLEVITIHCFCDTILGKLMITDTYLCNGQRLYSYTVKEGDTWEKVADKFATTVDNIRTLNGKYDKNEIPAKGATIMVYYKIIDGVLEVQRERTRLDP